MRRQKLSQTTQARLANLINAVAVWNGVMGSAHDRVDDSRTPIKYTSISVANPRFARVTGVLWRLLA